MVMPVLAPTAISPNINRQAPTVSKRIARVIHHRYLLPLTTLATRWVQLLSINGEYFLACFEQQDDQQYKFLPKLKEAQLVNNTTEKGPCLFLICTNGEFEFQADSKELVKAWLDILTDCGVKVLTFDQLYRLGRLVGEGSFAKVYVGNHTRTNEEVCVKEVEKRKVRDSNIYTEIDVLRRVNHPYIIRLYAAYEKEQTICLILEYLRGGELFEWLSGHGAYTEVQAKEALRRVLLGLQCLHQKGIVHRDLKTENLILEEKGNPLSLKIIDFGLASTIGSSTMRMRCGSPGYVAPEILEDRAYGVKVDIFSVGVILFTVLAGYPPFRGTNIKEILRRNLQCRVSFNHERWEKVSNIAMDLILWMTCRDPDRRCSATQALTHPWFEGVPPALGAVSPAAARAQKSEASSAAANLRPAPSNASTASTVGSHHQQRTASSSMCGSPAGDQSRGAPHGAGISQRSREVPMSTSATPTNSLKPQKIPLDSSDTIGGRSTASSLTPAAARSPASSTSPQQNLSKTVDAAAAAQQASHERKYSTSAGDRKNSNASAISSGSPLWNAKLQDPPANIKPLPAAAAAVSSGRPRTASERSPAAGGATPNASAPRAGDAAGGSVPFERTRLRSKTGTVNKKETSQLVQSLARRGGVNSKPATVKRASVTSQSGEERASQRVAAKAADVSSTATLYGSMNSVVERGKRGGARTNSLPGGLERLLMLGKGYESEMVKEGMIGIEGKRLNAIGMIGNEGKRTKDKGSGDEGKRMKAIGTWTKTRDALEYVDELTASVPCLPTTERLWGCAWNDDDSDEELYRDKLLLVSPAYMRACRFKSRASIASITSRTNSRRGMSFHKAPPAAFPTFDDEESSHPARKNTCGAGKTVRFAGNAVNRAPSAEQSPITPAATSEAMQRRRFKSLPTNNEKAARAAAEAAASPPLSIHSASPVGRSRSGSSRSVTASAPAKSPSSTRSNREDESKTPQSHSTAGAAPSEPSSISSAPPSVPSPASPSAGGQFPMSNWFRRRRRVSGSSPAGAAPTPSSLPPESLQQNGTDSSNHDDYSQDASQPSSTQSSASGGFRGWKARANMFKR